MYQITACYAVLLKYKFSDTCIKILTVMESCFLQHEYGTLQAKGLGLSVVQL